jgi:transcriptional regulator with XRE-family HTH domain
MHEDNLEALKEMVGARVRALRKERDWKQQTLTEMIGAKSHSTISEVENGHRMPSSATLRALAAVFDVSVDSLLGTTASEDSSTPETRALKASLRSELAELRSCLERATALVERHASRQSVETLDSP